VKAKACGLARGDTLDGKKGTVDVVRIADLGTISRDE
jgi:hypothetical protein